MAGFNMDLISTSVAWRLASLAYEDELSAQLVMSLKETTEIHSDFCRDDLTGILENKIMQGIHRKSNHFQKSAIIWGMLRNIL